MVHRVRGWKSTGEAQEQLWLTLQREQQLMEGWGTVTSLLPSIQLAPRACAQFPGHILKAMFSSGESSGFLNIGVWAPQDKGWHEEAAGP